MNWVHRAACVGMRGHTSDDAHDWEQAKRVCADCPVARPCADAGMTERTGVWGGLDPLERDYIMGRRSRLAGTSSQCLACGTPIARTGRTRKSSGGHRYCSERCRRSRRDVDEARRRALQALQEVFGAQGETAAEACGDDVPCGLDREVAS